MKKILTGLISALLIISLCACGTKSENVQSASADTTVVQQTAAPAVQADDASNYIGNWYVDAEKSGTDKLYVMFGSSFRDYGSELSIGDKIINFYIGATGGNGPYSFADGVFKAELTDFNEKQPLETEFKVFNENSCVYLTQVFPDGDGVLTVYWTKTPPKTDLNATPTPQVVYIVGDPNTTQTPATPTPEIVNVTQEPKNVYLKTLSTFESQYSAIVGAYQKAIAEKWSVENCYDKNVNYLVGYMNSNGTSGQLGYCYGDIDNNGIDELFIGVDKQIFAMYTIANNQTVQLIDAGERSAYYLEPDAVIVNDGSGSAFLHAYTFYHLDGSKLVVNNALVSDYSVNENDPWFYAEDDDWDVSNDKKLSTAKAEKWIKAYQDNYMTLPYIPLAEANYVVVG